MIISGSDCSRMAELELPDFNALSASFATASTEVANVRNLSVVNFAKQLNRMEKILGDVRRDVGELRQNVGELRPNVGELRQDMNRAYVNAVTSTLLELITDSKNREVNNFARLMNAKVTSDNIALMQLQGLHNALVPGFPATSAQIREMNGEQNPSSRCAPVIILIRFIGPVISNLPVAFGLPVDGSVDHRKNRFRCYIGLTVL